MTIAEQAEHWPTPNVPNGGRSSSTSNYTEDGRKRQIDLGASASHWPTPTAQQYGSSQNGINGIGGEKERPSANTPSLEKLSHSFHPDQPPQEHGDNCSQSDQNLHQRSPLLKRTHSDSSCPDSKAERLLKPRLNPQFVEWLMGFPIGWTGSALAETEWSRWRRQLRLEFLRIVR
jgi:DNA (cytosine-5)-methyltransferase 1